jgi:hypothetical protein
MLTACRPPLDKQLVGEWRSGCSIDICTMTSLKGDHTFSERFDQKGIDDPMIAGTWRVDGDQLVLHVGWQIESKEFQSAVGKDLRYTISSVQRDSLIATFIEAKNDPVRWKRLH